MEIRFKSPNVNKLMPRRIPDYFDAYAGWNLVSSIGSLISVVATVIFAYIIYDLFTSNRVISDNPWSVPAPFSSLDNNVETISTLEWALKNPIPAHAYSTLPIQ